MNLKQDFEIVKDKIEALAAIVTPAMENAAKQAYPITEKILTALESPAAIVAESLIPSGAAWAAEAITIITEALPAIKLISGIGDTSSTKGLLQRLGSNLTSIIHGGKHPFSWYVSAFDFFVFGIGGNPAATTESITA